MSKKSRGKITAFGERIIKVLKDNGFIKPDGTPNYSEAERLCGLKGSYLSKAVRGDSMHEEKAKKFIGKFRVNPEWLKRGVGNTYVENGTSVPDEQQIKNPSLDEARILKKLDSLTDNVNEFADMNRWLRAEVDRLKRRITDLGGQV